MIVYDQNFYGRGYGGVVDGEEVAVKDAFNWGGGGGSLGYLSRNISKQGVGKGKRCS